MTILDEFNERIKPVSDQLDRLLEAHEIEYTEVRNHPKECEHEVVEFRDEELQVSKREKYHINGLWCVQCETYLDEGTNDDLPLL